MTSTGKRALKLTAALGLLLALSACHYHYGGYGYRGHGGYYGHGGGHGNGHYKRGHW